MDATTEKLAEYAAGLTYGDLTATAIHSIKRCIIDSLGCAMGAFDAAPVRAVRELAAEISSHRPATLIGTDIRSSPEQAAFVNATMIRYLDFSDDYFGGSGEMGPHPSDNIGAVFAAAESRGVGGRDVILGIAIAYEAVGQIVDQIVLGGVQPT